MRPVVFHRHTVSYFKRLPADRKEQVVEVMESLRPLLPPGQIAGPKAMQGEWQGC